MWICLKKTLIHRLYEALNSRNLDVLDELFAENYISHANPPRPDLVGVKDSKELLANYLSAFPDLHVSVEEILADGDAVAYRWILEGTHTGSNLILPIPATGKKVTIIGCSLLHVKDGKFVDEWEYWDQTALLEQLGVMSPA